jgi:hypothetical protein
MQVGYFGGRLRPARHRVIFAIWHDIGDGFHIAENREASPLPIVPTILARSS